MYGNAWRLLVVFRYLLSMFALEPVHGRKDASGGKFFLAKILTKIFTKIKLSNG